MIKFIEVRKTPHNYGRAPTATPREETRYELDEIWLNPSAILQIKSDRVMKSNFDAGAFPEGLDSRQEFSRIHFGAGNNVSVITVVGDSAALVEKLFGASKRLLKN